MVESISVTGERPQNRHLRPPYKPGESGNPGGRHGPRKQLFAELSAELGPLTAADTARLSMAVDSVVESRNSKLSADQRNKHRRTANVILQDLRKAHVPEPTAPDLHAYLAKGERA
jgi:hypothetical protein